MCHVTAKVTPNNYMPKIARVRIVQGEGKEKSVGKRESVHSSVISWYNQVCTCATQSSPCRVVLLVEFLLDVSRNILQRERKRKPSGWVKKCGSRANNCLQFAHDCPPNPNISTTPIIPSFLTSVKSAPPQCPDGMGEISSARRRTNLLNVVLRQCLRRNIHSILLHFLAHIGILDYRFPLFRHCFLLLSRFPHCWKTYRFVLALNFFGRKNEAQIKTPCKINNVVGLCVPYQVSIFTLSVYEIIERWETQHSQEALIVGWNQ